MHKYPDTDDPDFYKIIDKKFSRYTIPKKKKTMKQICFPKKYELQIPQKFLAEFMNPSTPYKGLLVYHKIGSGKTCTAINIAEKFKKHKKILVVLPASLKDNFRSELRSPCAGEKYLTTAERSLLNSLHPSEKAYKDIISKSDERIDKYYTIHSYNKFIQLLKDNEISLRNTLLIIDEVHNMVSETGTYYETLYDTIREKPSGLRIVILTATPIFDKPIEAALTMNLLLDKDNELPIGKDFVDTFMDIEYIQTKTGDLKPNYFVKNMELFKEAIQGYVSYFKGAPAYVFPKEELNIVKCNMSNTQLKLYKKVFAKERKSGDIDDYVNEEISNSFFIGTRMISNFVFPNKKIGEKGFESLKDSDLTTEKLKEYSPKFLKILRRIKRCTGTIFVYSNFKEYGGIKVFVRMLEQHRYKNYEYHGSGRKRFAVFSGDQDIAYKGEIKAVFNKKDNEDGSQLKIIIGSSASKEGISFLRVQQVHILEPYWNWSRLFQIIGRAIRFCSHKDVPPEQQLVKVYIYLATHPTIPLTVDQRIMEMAINKKRVNMYFEKALKEAAIDCALFRNANVGGDDDSIVCET